MQNETNGVNSQPQRPQHKGQKFVKSLDGRKRDKNAQRHGQSKHSQNSYEMGFQTKRPLNNDPFDPTSAIASAMTPHGLAGFHQTFTSLTTSNSAQGIGHHNPFLSPAGMKAPMSAASSLLPSDASYLNQIATSATFSQPLSNQLIPSLTNQLTRPMTTVANTSILPSTSYPNLGFQPIPSGLSSINDPNNLFPDFSENDLLNVLGQHSLEKNLNSYVNPNYDYSQISLNKAPIPSSSNKVPTLNGLDINDEILSNVMSPMSSVSHCPTSPGEAPSGLDIDASLDTSGSNPFQFQNDQKLNSNYINQNPTRPPSSMSMASVGSSRSLKTLNAPEKFSRQLVDIVFGLWNNRNENPEDPITALPKNSDDKSYREEQIEQLGARIHKDLRRMKQNNPGHANNEFINVLNLCLKMAKTTDLKEKEIIKDKLRKSSCVHSISSKTQDGRIQIEKWEAASANFPNGKAKKVYIFWELYNLFNIIDENRYDRQNTKIRHTHLYRAYCKANEVIKDANLICLNPFHYEAVMDHAKFHSELQKILETYRHMHNQKSILFSKEKHNAFTLWTRDLLKYADWSSNCSPKKFIAIVQSRLDTRANTIEALGKKLQHFGLNRQPCLYYTERTPRDKIDELEQRLVEFCRPEVFRKLEQNDGNRRRDIKWSCDNENKSRYCCNPDHVDSYCPNTIAFSGKNPIFAVINRVMHRNNVAKALHNVTEDYKRWCFISFIRFSTTSKRNAIIENAKNQNAQINSMILNSQDKNIHDTYEGYYKDSGTISAGAEKILCEIKVEPFKVTDHHEKNYYKGKFKHPSEFNLQYKPFDDATRCSLFKHSCKPPICERSFVKRKIDFKFSLLLRRSKKSNMFGLGSDAEIVESITIENTGSTNLYINSFHNDIIEYKDKRNPLRYENFLQISSSPPKFHVLHPNNRKDLLVLDNHFRTWIQQFNSKQIRAMKEHLWSINICIDDVDWNLNVDGSRSPPGSLSDTEHFHIISLLHYMYVSEFEKNLTTSELMDSK